MVGHFDGGDITSDAGGLLLREVEKRTGIIRRFAACFRDRRDPRFTEFTVEELVAQRVYGLALGYEDLNDHDQLRSDPTLAVMVGREDVKGEHRRVEQDCGKALAGKSTLNRLELTEAGRFSSDPYKKIGRDDAAIDGLFVDHFLESHEKPPLGRSFWMRMPPMIRYTATRKGGSITATTIVTVTCRCTYSVASFYCVRA